MSQLQFNRSLNKKKYKCQRCHKMTINHYHCPSCLTVVSSFYNTEADFSGEIDLTKFENQTGGE